MNILVFRYIRDDLSMTHNANAEALVCEKPQEFFFWQCNGIVIISYPFYYKQVETLWHTAFFPPSCRSVLKQENGHLGGAQNAHKITL